MGRFPQLALNLAAVAAFVKSDQAISSSLLLAAGNKANMLQPGTIVDGRYEILGILGEGGAGLVYKARQESLDRLVALKVLNPTHSSPAFKARFEREAAVVAALKHRNIVTFYGYGVYQDSPYIAMELLQGISLEQYLRKAGKMPINATLDIIDQICDGLHCAHAHDILHRDLKPSNIMLLSSNADCGYLVKLIDFGLARAAIKSQEEQQRLTEGMFVGSVLYASPEQFVADAKLDQRSDIYSLGCIMHHCLSGLPPFSALHTILIGQQHLRAVPPLISGEQDPSEIPTAVLDVLSRAMAKDPAQRYQSATEVQEDLEKIKMGAHQRISASGMSLVVPPLSQRQHRTSWLFLGSASLVIVFAAISFTLINWHAQQRKASLARAAASQANGRRQPDDRHLANPSSRKPQREPHAMWRYYLYQGSKQSEQSQFQQETESYETALSLMDATTPVLDQIEAKLGAAEGHRACKRFRKGLSLVTEALTQLEKLGGEKLRGQTESDHNGIDLYGRALRVTAGIYAGMKNYEQGLHFYQRLLRYCGNDYLYDRTYALHSIGIIYIDMKEWQSAIDAFTRDLELKASAGLEPNPWSYSNRAYAHQCLHHFDQALSDYDSAIAIFRKSNQLQVQDTMLRAELSKALLCAKLGQQETARKLLLDIVDQPLFAIAAEEDIRDVKEAAKVELARLSRH
jgi:serine/threonine protein kinase